MDEFYLLKQEILSCRDCQTNFGFEPRPIFWGDKDAKIFQISQAPSLKAHEQRKPFADASGKRLLQWYGIDEKMFYNTKNFYITALSHCYPGKNTNGKDAAPSVYCARKWLYRELGTVKNKIYIIIGAKAAKFFFRSEKFEDLVFEDQIFNDKLTLVLPHPSPLNYRWFKRYPDFFVNRLPWIRKIILDTLL